MDRLTKTHREELTVLRHEMMVTDTETSSLTSSLDKEVEALRKQAAEALAEREQMHKEHEARVKELQDEGSLVREQLHALQQVRIFSVSRGLDR